MLQVAPTAPESAIERTRLGAEQRARTTTVALVATAQNGTSDVLAGGKHARRGAAWATPRTDALGDSARGAVVSPGCTNYQCCGIDRAWTRC